MTIADPSIVIEDGAGYLVADVIAREFVDTSSTGEMTETTSVRLATLDLSAGAVQVVDGRLVGTGVPAVLTAEGVPAFADFYQAGDQLDPVTFSVPVGDGTELDLTRFDTAPATVGEDGTVELTWTVPSDAALGTHTVHLVTEVPDAGPVVVADASFTVVAAAAGGSGDGPAGGTGAAAPAAPLAKTGADVGALAALSVGVLLLGAAAVATRRRATA